MNWIGLQTNTQREISRFLRVSIQTLVSPWINAFLYIFIFGFVVGSRIDTIAGISYIEFVIPGIIMLNVITSSFMQTSSSLYFGRFVRYIEELLVSPLSMLEIILSHVIAGVARGVMVGVGVYAIAILFGVAGIDHPFLFLLYAVSIALLFSFLGLIIGLWSDNFEQLSIVGTFVITPLTFLGGMFNSVTMLPPAMQQIVKANPFFYFVDGFRYSMTGVQEASLVTGALVIAGLVMGLGWLTHHLFHIGWKIRE